jgi:hypothetical protein
MAVDPPVRGNLAGSSAMGVRLVWVRDDGFGWRSRYSTPGLATHAAVDPTPTHPGKRNLL